MNVQKDNIYLSLSFIYILTFQHDNYDVPILLLIASPRYVTYLTNCYILIPKLNKQTGLPTFNVAVPTIICSNIYY